MSKPKTLSVDKYGITPGPPRPPQAGPGRGPGWRREP